MGPNSIGICEVRVALMTRTGRGARVTVSFSFSDLHRRHHDARHVVVIFLRPFIGFSLVSSQNLSCLCSLRTAVELFAQGVCDPVACLVHHSFHPFILPSVARDWILVLWVTVERNSVSLEALWISYDRHPCS
jgi:hypothetical protein